MAEIIKEIQERDLPEYEAIKSSGICTDEELRQLMRERERYETKIVQSKKNLINYLEFIQFEKNTHKWILEKETQLHCLLPNVKKSIIQRIIKLYRNATQQFPEEERLWQSFIQFSKKSNPNQVAGIYEKMLSYHGDKDSVWCAFALWSYESSKQLKPAKEIFFRALKRNPLSEVINFAFFDVLVKETLRISDLSNNLNAAERQLGLQRAVLLYRNNRANIKNVSYFLKLLERCEEPQYINCTVLIQKEIIDDLMNQFSGEAIVWDFLAQRELRGYNMIDLQEIATIKEAEVAEGELQLGIDPESLIKDQVWKLRGLKTRIELCFKVYEKAVEALASETMWNYFINAMLQLNKDTKMEGDLKRHCLAKAFNMGHKSQMMSAEHYRACVQMLLTSPNGILQVEKLLKEAISFRKCPQLYELWMQAYAKEDNELRFYEIFCSANKELGTEKCVALWQMAINFYKLHYEEHGKKLTVLLQEAAEQMHPEFGQFRPYYLEYTMCYESLQKTRDLYDKLCQYPPPCLELHQKMIQIEMQAGAKNSLSVARIRKYYENAAHFFGKSNINVWLELLKFERDHGDIKSMSVIYDRAKATLEPELVDTFITEYSLIKVLL